MNDFVPRGTPILASRVHSINYVRIIKFHNVYICPINPLLNEKLLSEAFVKQ